MNENEAVRWARKPWRAPAGWPAEKDLRSIAEVEDECVADGVGELFHRTLADAYRAKKGQPVAAATLWTEETVIVVIICEGGYRTLTSRLFKPLTLDI